MEAAQIIDEKLDPVNRAILSEPLSKNAKLFVQRTTVRSFLKLFFNLFILATLWSTASGSAFKFCFEG